MRTIWKFPVPVADDIAIAIPEGAEVLTVQMQGEAACLWAKCNPESGREVRRFRLIGTGHTFPDAMNLRYVGTFQPTSYLVFHLFEMLP